MAQSIVKETWLSQKPNPQAFVVSAIMTFLLALGSLIYLKNWGGSLDWMPATKEALYQDHSVWRAWSALFAHGDEKHLLSNSFLFFILGAFLGGYFGFFTFPFVAFLLGGVINFLVVMNMNPQAQLIGASGIVFWMGGAWLSLYFLLDLKRDLYQRTIRAFGVALVLFFPAQAFDPQTSYSSHLIGFILGVSWGFAYYFFNQRKFENAIVREEISEDT